jgi:hypothetical protein
MAFARKRDTVCPGQQLTQLEGPLLGTFPTSRDVRLESGMQTKADVRQPP